MMSGDTNNLLIRTVTGLVFVAVVLAGMLGGVWAYTSLLVAVGLWCCHEFSLLARTRRQKVWGPVYILGCMAAMWFFPVLGGAGGAGGGMTGGMNVWAESGMFGESCNYPAWWDVRIAPAFAVIVWANDIFAYLVGVSLGRNKMAPRISPHKSWEGFAGGVIGAMVTAAFVGQFWIGGMWTIWVPFGLVVALAAVGGDLAESWFKRAAGVKDSGRLLPGHGGLLDRFDATLGAVPAAFLFFLITWLVR